MPSGYHRNKLNNLQIDQYTESLYKYFCINTILHVLVVFLFGTLCCRGAAGGWVEFVSVLELLLSPLTHLQRVWVNQHLLKCPDHQSARCKMIFRQSTCYVAALLVQVVSRRVFSCFLVSAWAHVCFSASPPVTTALISAQLHLPPSCSTSSPSNSPLDLCASLLRLHSASVSPAPHLSSH